MYSMRIQLLWVLEMKLFQFQPLEQRIDCWPALDNFSGAVNWVVEVDNRCIDHYWIEVGE